MKLKTIHVPRGYDGLHLEVDGAIVNVYVGLQDIDGHRVTTVGVRPDRYGGEAAWSVEDSSGRWHTEHVVLRIVQETVPEQRRRERKQTREREKQINAEVRAAEERIEEGQARWSETGSSRKR